MAGFTPLLVVEIGCAWRWVGAALLLLVVAGNCTAFVGGYYYTPVDLAPPWAATLSGLTSTFIGLNGLVAPLVVAHLTPTVLTHLCYYRNESELHCHLIHLILLNTNFLLENITFNKCNLAFLFG